MAPTVMESLKTEYEKYEDVDVRMEALKRIADFVTEITELSEDSFKILAEACGDRKSKLRNCAFDLVVAIGTENPTLLPTALDIIRTKCEDEDDEVRVDAIEPSFGLSIFAGHEEDMSGALSIRIQDQNPQIRKQAVGLKRQLTMTEEERKVDDIRWLATKFIECDDVEALLELTKTEEVAEECVELILKATSRTFDCSKSRIRKKGRILLQKSLDMSIKERHYSTIETELLDSTSRHGPKETTRFWTEMPTFSSTRCP